MKTVLRILFPLSGLIPLFGLLGEPLSWTPIIYTLFVGACLVRRPLQALADRTPGRDFFKLLLCFWVAGSLTETFAWLNNYVRQEPNPALFHPQLVWDLVIGVGFYGGWAVAWRIALRWFHFTLAETFIITGIQGIFFEQVGAVFIAMVQAFGENPFRSIILGLYVFVVHGSAVGLAMVPVLHRYESPTKPRHWIRIPFVCVLMVGLAWVGVYAVGLISLLLGGFPPHRSIVEHPFW